MQIVLATGIYPPQIGGIATYALKLGEALRKAGHEVKVLTYDEVVSGQWSAVSGPVVKVSKRGTLLFRWMRYARALREHASNADAVIALSSVSVGVPLMLARLKKPKKILRLGGDFFWERYTDGGGTLGLAEWYSGHIGFWKLMNTTFMEAILRSFDSLVYSTEFQRTIHERAFRDLPPREVIENALPSSASQLHTKHEPLRILSMSRHVGFKNLFALVEAMPLLPDARCTFIGSGPLEGRLRARAALLGLTDRIAFASPVSGAEKERAFSEHDVLIIPSTTEISPNTGLEARAAGLPVLLTTQTGLSERLTRGMVLANLRTPRDIAAAVKDIASRYDAVARDAAQSPIARDWPDVAADWQQFLQQHA